MDVDLAVFALLSDLQDLDRTVEPIDRQRLISAALASLKLIEDGGGGSLGLARCRSIAGALHAERRDS